MDSMLTRSALLTLLGGMIIGFGFGIATLHIARPDFAEWLTAWSGLFAVIGPFLVMWATVIRRRAMAATAAR